MKAFEEKDPVFYLESLLNLYVRSMDKKGIVVLETVKTGSEKDLIAGLDQMRRKDFLSEYLVMHVYTTRELPPRALQLMNHLGEYYSKSPVIEEHYLPAGFEPEPGLDVPVGFPAENAGQAESEHHDVAIDAGIDATIEAPIDAAIVKNNMLLSETNLSAQSLSPEIKKTIAETNQRNKFSKETNETRVPYSSEPPLKLTHGEALGISALVSLVFALLVTYLMRSNRKFKATN